MLVLRKEIFGGTVFNPANAHHLDVDSELFEHLLSDLEGCPTNSPSLKDAYRELGSFSPGIRLVDNESVAAAFPFNVYSMPVLADIAITRQCNLSCPHCYMESSAKGGHMKISVLPPPVLSNCAEN